MKAMERSPLTKSQRIIIDCNEIDPSRVEHLERALREVKDENLEILFEDFSSEKSFLFKFITRGLKDNVDLKKLSFRGCDDCDESGKQYLQEMAHGNDIVRRSLSKNPLLMMILF